MEAAGAAGPPPPVRPQAEEVSEEGLEDEGLQPRGGWLPYRPREDALDNVGLKKAIETTLQREWDERRRERERKSDWGGERARQLAAWVAKPPGGQKPAGGGGGGAAARSPREKRQAAPPPPPTTLPPIPPDRIEEIKPRGRRDSLAFDSLADRDSKLPAILTSGTRSRSPRAAPRSVGVTKGGSPRQSLQADLKAAQAVRTRLEGDKMIRLA